MAEIGISVAAKVAEYAVDPVLRLATRHAQFLFCAAKIKRNLDSMKDKLRSKQESVLKQKEDARNRNEITVEAVKNWLNEVSEKMREMEQLEEQMQQKGSSCCWGWCSTPKGYRLCKQMAKLTESMQHLNNQHGEFDQFFSPAPIPDIEFYPSGNFFYFECTKLASEQLLEALQDNDVYMIALHGMGGCGKTTLAKEVGKTAKERKLFDHVVFTAVSKSVIVTNIQNEIAEILNFAFQKTTEGGRARELSLRLQNGGKVLIILDDVWSSFNLDEDVGIPPSSNCKVLLTTRLQQVCAPLGCVKKIQLGLLSSKEAWTLFQKNVNVVDESKSVAHDIVEECKGLPIAIVAVARSLKDRSPDVWKVALNNLKTAKPIDVVEGERDAYSCLQFSYDQLQKAEAKLLLKICSMFPEDHKIPLEELFRYGVGLGICQEVESFDVARSIVNAAIDDLVCSSLLFCEIYMGGKFFKIHDLVRDVCLWIASKEKNGIIMVDPERDLNSGFIKNCYAISLWNKEIDRFPQYLVTSKLQILLLNAKNSVDFPHASFKGMEKLKVMSLFDFSITSSLSWAFSTQRFDNLHTLRLKKLQIGNIYFVENLKRLRILDLEGSSFKKLPNGIANINELKLMDLTDCRIEEDCYEVIGRCSQLAELYICGGRVVLPFKCFLYNTFPKLQRYHLSGGNAINPWNFLGEFGAVRFGDNDVNLWNFVGELRAVRFGDLNISNSGATIKDLLQRANSICLARLVGGCKSIIPEFVEAAGKMDELTQLSLQSCSEIECIIDTSNMESCILEANANQLRDEVSTHYLGKLERLELKNSPSQSLRLQYLQSLSIYRCGKLKCLFPTAIHYNFPKLAVLEINDCEELEKIMTENEEPLNPSNTQPYFPKLQKLEVVKCNKLKCLFSVLIAEQLPQLEELYREKILLPNLRELTLEKLPIFVSICIGLKVDVVKLQLVKLYIDECPKFDAVYVQCSTEGYRLNGGNNSDICDDLNIAIIKDLLQRESSVGLHGLAGSTIRISFNEAAGLLLFGRSKVESIIDITESFQVGAESPKLVKLKIQEMGYLKEIIRGPPSLLCVFEKLEYLCIEGCGKLTSLFPLSAAQSLTQLKDLNVLYCCELKHIILRGMECVHPRVRKSFP